MPRTPRFAPSAASPTRLLLSSFPGLSDGGQHAQETRVNRQRQHGAEIRSGLVLPPFSVSSFVSLSLLSLLFCPFVSWTRTTAAGNGGGGGVSSRFGKPGRRVVGQRLPWLLLIG